MVSEPIPGAATDPGVRAYLKLAAGEQPVVNVRAGDQGGAIWIVTEVRAAGDVERLKGLFRAEREARAVARKAGGAPLIFRVVDLDIGERADDAPLALACLR